MKSGTQMMIESLIGPDGLKAIEECKRILPAVPQLIENIKREWESMRNQQTDMLHVLERIATQNNLILSKLEDMGFKIDPNKTEELPPTLAHHIHDLKMVICSHCGAEVPDLVGCIKCGYGVVEHPTILEVTHGSD